MNNKPVSLNLKKSVSLPQAVILPATLRGKLGGERRLTIQTRTQSVPTAVRDWLRADKRYAGWFEAEAAPQPAPNDDPYAEMTDDELRAQLLALGAERQPILDENNEPVSIEDATREQLIREVQDEEADAPEGERWSESMVVPVLRDYAKQHGVELSSDDRKEDILFKLRFDERTHALQADAAKDSDAEGEAQPE